MFLTNSGGDFVGAASTTSLPRGVYLRQGLMSWPVAEGLTFATSDFSVFGQGLSLTQAPSLALPPNFPAFPDDDAAVGTDIA